MWYFSLCIIAFIFLICGSNSNSYPSYLHFKHLLEDYSFSARNNFTETFAAFYNVNTTKMKRNYYEASVFNLGQLLAA